MDDPSAPEPARIYFYLSLGALVIVAAVGGAVVGTTFWGQKIPPPSASEMTEGQLAAVLEHAELDVRIGRGQSVLEARDRVLHRTHVPEVRDRVLRLRAEAAVQAASYGVAEESLRELESLLDDTQAKRAAQLERIGLLAALGRDQEAQALVAEVIAGAANDPRIADQARLRLLAASQDPEALQGWLDKVDKNDPEAARLAGLAALRLRSDAEQAVSFLEAARAAGSPADLALLESLLAAYSALSRPSKEADVLAAMIELDEDENDRSRLALYRADALGQAGDVEAGLALADDILGTTRSFEVRRAARRLRFELLELGGKLEAELARLEAAGDQSARAYVALEIEHDYASAEHLYAELSRAHPDSADYYQCWQEAKTKADLSEQKELYGKVLQRDPHDPSAVRRYLSAAVQLGEMAPVADVVRQQIQGREKDSAALVELAEILLGAGLADDAISVAKQAYGAEQDADKKQRLLFVLGDMLAAGQYVAEARRLYSDLAGAGATQALRQHALARLAALH